MKTSLELFQLDAGKYPLPTDGENITYSGGTVWTQGTFGDSVFKNVDSLDKIPTDPLSDSVYTYSVTPTRTEYELGGIIETDFVLNHPLTPSLAGGGISQNVYAGETEALAIVTGTYNGQMVKTFTGGTTCNVLSIPSIIASDIETSKDLVEISNNKRFVYNGYNNLPSSYKSSKFKVDGGFDFKVNKLVAYTDTGSCTELTNKSSYDARVELIDGLQESYSGTTLKGKGKIKRLLALDIDIANPSIEVQNFAGSFVNNNLGGEVEIVFQTQSFDNTTCKTILDTGGSSGDGFYFIDPTNSGTSFSAYCDMAGGGWTNIIGPSAVTLVDLAKFGDTSEIASTFYDDAFYGIGWGTNDNIPKKMEIAIPYSDVLIEFTGKYDDPAGGLGFLIIDNEASNTDSKRIIYFVDAWGHAPYGQTLRAGLVEYYFKTPNNEVGRTEIINYDPSTYLEISMYGYTGAYPYTKRYIEQL